MKSIPRIIWIAPAILLLFAVLPLPYGYYTFTRIVTCGAAGLISVFAFREKQVVSIWSVLFAAVAVLFNPFIPIHLTRSTWFFLDLGAMAVFTAHLVFVHQKIRIRANQKPNHSPE